MVEYNDSTHTAEQEWIKLACVDIRPINLAMTDDGIEQFYTISCLPGPLVPLTNKGDPDRRLRTLNDTLALALGRVGLLTPEITPELLEELLELDEEDGVVIVPDTNALHNGALHWLLRVLRRPSVWLLPVVASLTTVQTRDAMVKELVGQRKPNKLVQALRSRGLVNGALGLLQRNRGRCQVVEIDPSLLRYQKQSSSSGMDPDQSDVLEDRLIIEAIHGVLRSMRSRSARRVVTSDVNIARVLEAEGIRTLFVPTIVLPEAPVACLRFDALARTFIGAPLRALLWELAHAFGSVGLKCNDEQVVRLDCYWAGKTPAHWSSETLKITVALAKSLSSPSPQEAMKASTDYQQAYEAENRTRTSASVAPDRTDQFEEAAAEKTLRQPTSEGGAELGKVGGYLSQRNKASGGADAGVGNDMFSPPLQGGKRAVVGKRSTKGRLTAERFDASPAISDAPDGGAEGRVRDENDKDRKRDKAHGEANRQAIKRERESSIVLPRASLPQAFNLLSAARKTGSGTAEKIVAASADEPITVDNARRALEILTRVGLLKRAGELYSAASEVQAVDSAFSRGDLDAVSAIMLRFEPYKAFVELLQLRGSIPRGDVTDELRQILGNVGSYESERLPRFHVLLGQAWTQGDVIMDGSRRPTDRDASDAFVDAFEASASDGIASVLDLLRLFCERTRMSPWAAKRRVEGFVRENLLSKYAFQTAAGRRPIARDAVLNGGLDTLRLEPVIIDRLQLGQRPVFTIERKTK